MENEKDISGNTTNKTMEYANATTITRSVIDQTEPEIEVETKEEKEAKNLIKKAKALNQPRCCLFSICSSKEERLQEMDNLYLRAGDLYKSIHHYRVAAICYENSTIIKKKLKQDPLNSYEKAYFCYEKIDIGDDTKRIFDEMNSCLEKEAKFFQVGKNYENLAIKKENKEKYDIAIEYYLQAVKYYEKDDTKHKDLKTKIFVKLSELMILHNHPQAKDKVPIMLEKIGYHYLKNIMTKYQAKEYFGKGVLTRIYFNDDIKEAKEYMLKYKKKDKTFEESNIFVLCMDVITCIEKGENDNLNSDIEEYKETYELDEYMTYILDNIINRENHKNKTKEKNKEDNNENIEDKNNTSEEGNNDININNEEKNIL